ncbi:hypothetical protein BHU72_12975 [Desulfuribacillus stibiiarsenatis]|uniref:Phosphoglycerate mutase n=1 Tax=Desulfuribacillus stibiiarsenatis TaxID=1390249 RepID=A0A1E5L950_9FIRM|nr:histidine phosphatase family protein [Desulfuribacillus stibiiarsenatis]OEH86519.1 hypothetical protein BHU72_12975 [Desulfuribacillus stibiiarsenatis]
MRLFLVRHGQTVANAERRFQGHKDFPLSNIGEKQAERVAERFKKTRIQQIYSSDLGRAYNTAQTIASYHQLPVVKEKLFREYSWGVFDGLTLKEAAIQFPEIAENNASDWSAVDIPEKEAYLEFLQRAQDALQLLVDRHMGEKVLVVSHGRFLNALMTQILRLVEDHVWAFTFANTSVSVVDFAHGQHPKVRLFNDTSHLIGLPGIEDYFNR